ncbi:hypothetical protein BDV59DRAFT_190331 [Aspergillus ambiguus]|uniref:uncharacterized protein n=1 Tax=Aspergillus ambiguus TaxID=176160 RepID=UPI003CCCDF53
MDAYRIGIDVGGTNTDAAIINIAATDSPSRGVCACAKTPTTPDVTTGIYTAIEDALSKSGISRENVVSVAVGTTHFVNAVVQADTRRLSKVAVVRLCGPFTKQVPPFAEFPSDLREIMGGPTFYLDGGLEIDGREIATLNNDQIKETVRSIRNAGVKMVALVGVFSPLDHNGIHEETCKKLMLELDPSLSIVCSHSIGGVGLLERENATILNASILTLARKTVGAFCRAMAELQLDCPLYLTQNDGTLTNAATAAELPIKTFASGPTNSMTGAAFLASLDKGCDPARCDTQVLVVDVGGTTSDVCALLPSGFPRQAPNFVEVGGVRTAFSMPEVLSIGLGGGSRVQVDSQTGEVIVGPESVGHHLTTQAKGDIGDKAKVQDVSPEIIGKARAQIKKLLERAVDGMKISDQPVTLLLVGGGSVVHMDSLRGVAECIIPPHHDSANAVGAAIAKVAGEVDMIELLAEKNEGDVLKAAKAKAVEAAVSRGADRDDVKIVEIDKIPLAYATNKATRLIIKAVGRLAPPNPREPNLRRNMADATRQDMLRDDEEEPFRVSQQREKSHSSVKYAINVDFDTYKPDVRNNTWYLSPVDLEFIAAGTGVLGTGGGGPSRLQYLASLQLVLDPSNAGKMRVVAAKSLSDTDICASGSWFGAPSVSGERIPAGTELSKAIDNCIRIAGLKSFHAMIVDEIGGGNGMSAFPSGVAYDVPVIDGDLMGRAYPTMEHSNGFKEAESNRRVETMLRTQCVDLGLKIGVSSAPLTGKTVKKYVVPNTISQSWYIGRAVHHARRSKINMIKAIFDTSPGKLLYTGKIIDVKRDVSRGYTMGYCLLAPLSPDEIETGFSDVANETRPLIIPFQNEFLYAAYTDLSAPDDMSKQQVVCTVPDLISILGQDGEAIGSQELRYGLKVDVIAMAAHPLWTTEAGLKVGGPRGFGLNMEWTKLGEYWEPRSVIEEFNQPDSGMGCQIA